MKKLAINFKDLREKDSFVYQVTVLKILFSKIAEEIDRDLCYKQERMYNILDFQEEVSSLIALSECDSSFHEYLGKINWLFNELIEGDGKYADTDYDVCWKICKNIIDDPNLMLKKLSIHPNISVENKEIITNTVSENLKQFLLKRGPSLLSQYLDLGALFIGLPVATGLMTALCVFCLITAPTAGAVVGLIFSVAMFAFSIYAMFSALAEQYKRYQSTHSIENPQSVVTFQPHHNFSTNPDECSLENSVKLNHSEQTNKRSDNSVCQGEGENKQSQLCCYSLFSFDSESGKNDCHLSEINEVQAPKHLNSIK